MKISTNNTPRYSYIKQNEPIKASTSGQIPSKICKKFDEIQIQADSSNRSENFFIKELTGKLSLEIRQFSPSHKLQELSKQIDDPSYSVDLEEVANKILLQ